MILIEPVGIETTPCLYGKRQIQQILIEPVGIETYDKIVIALCNLRF